MSSKNTDGIREFVDNLLQLRSLMWGYNRKRIRESHLDLTYQMVRALGVLWRRGSVNQQQIADELQKNKASLTSLLDNLEKRNLITRTEDIRDRRNKIITLTETGIMYEKEVKVVLADFYETLGQDITKSEQLILNKLLSRMKENLKQH